MDTLPILDESGAPLILAGFHIAAYMQWPYDPETRLRFTDEHEALIIAEIAARREGAGREEAVIRRSAARRFDRAYDPERARPRWAEVKTTGQILRAVIRHRTSVDREIRTIADDHAALGVKARKGGQPAPQIAANRAALWKLWGIWKPVSPLCAAYCDWRDGEPQLDLYDPKCLRYFLARSEAYRLAAESYFPPRSTKPTLAPGVALRAPSELKLDDLIAVSFPRPPR